MNAIDDSNMPPGLREAIARDLRSVVPLQPPLVRMLAVAPLGIVLLVGSVLVFSLRVDAPALGLGLTWGVSALQMSFGLLLTAAALREAVPGSTLRRGPLALALGLALVSVIVIPWTTWQLSPTQVPRRAVDFVWRVCFTGAFISAMPPLALSAWLVARAYPLRPAVAGLLYGAGAGLMADAGWRLFCHYSDPAHVFAAHTLAILATAAAGALAARGARN
jgi:hypothetical protein